MAKRAAAKKGPKGPKKNPKTRSDVPGAKGSVIGDNSKGSRLSFEDERALFTKHRQAWNAYQARQAAVDELRADVVQALKNDGFNIQHMKIADDFANAKGEKRQVAAVEDRLKVARWIGHKMGSQLDLFNEPDRRPIDEVAFEEGVLASQENRPAKPPYDPGHPRYQPWLKGYAKDQERLKANFKAPAEKPGVTSKDGDPVKGGDPVPRSEFNQRLQETAAEGDALAKGQTQPAEPPAEAPGTKH